MTALEHQAGFIEPGLARLAAAYRARDEAAFDAVLAALVACRAGPGEEGASRLLDGLRRIALDLQGALQRFSIDARLADYARRDIPDARARLERVLTLTDAAAHRTLDLIERSGPLAAETAASARVLLARLRDAGHIEREDTARLLERSAEAMDAIRRNLAEALLAQGYQDLTGQIIRSVMDLVADLERALVDLWRLGDPASLPSRREPVQGSRGSGPAVPGVDGPEHVHAQQDVDALLSDLGM